MQIPRAGRPETGRPSDSAQLVWKLEHKDADQRDSNQRGAVVTGCHLDSVGSWPEAEPVWVAEEEV